MKISYLDILDLSLFIPCPFKVTMVVFAYVFEEFNMFANNGPLPNVIFAPYILNTPCLTEN